LLFFFSEHYVLGHLYTIFWPIYLYIAKTALSGAQTSLQLCYLDQSELINGGYYNNCQLGNLSQLARNQKVRDDVIKYSVDLIRTHNEMKRLI